MKLSTIVILAGVALFVLPIPGTFVTGALALVVGVAARWLGF